MTKTSCGRVHYGYIPYSPQSAEKLLDMFRVYYNYCFAGLKKMTPTMRLGLASRPVPLDELVGVR